MLKRILNLLLFLCFITSLKAQYGNIEFIENKGQWDSQVKYKGDIPAGSFFIRSNGFTVLQHNTEDLALIYELLHNHPSAATDAKISKSHILRSHSYNVDFVGASPNFEIVPDKILNNYNNYFIGNDPSKWAGDCRIYQAVTLKNVYPNVDVRYYTEGGRMKYDIIARPGADIKKIALKYDGVEKLQLKNKELVVETSVGNVKELAPFTYQSHGIERNEVSCKYVIENNIVRFDVKNYDPSSTLIIDPVLVFASFSGSTVDNWGFTATYGPDGSMYGGGIVFGSGFPVSPGAFQASFGGGESPLPVDIGIIKLSPNGQSRMFATYVGGSGNEQPHSLIVDPQGNLIFAGRTSSPNYPTTGSGQGAAGGYDIVVTKFNASGSALIGSKRIGGKNDDGVNINSNRSGAQSLQRNYGDDGRSEVMIDGAGDIYVASCTRSTDFPVTGGSFQTTFGGGSQDGVVLKFDPSVNNLLFASYLGGSDDDAAYVLSLDPAGNLYVGGGTASTDFGTNRAGTIGASNQGGIDGFVAVIASNGSSLIRSTYLGTSGIDQVYGIQFDNNGFPYVMGQTTGNWPVINATYSNAGAKQFIAKLKPDLSAYVYSTVFGKSASVPSISPVAFLVDRCENVYVSGWGGGFGTAPYTYPSSGTMGLPVTGDALKSTTDGKDFYFFVLQKNAVAQLFGSFYGEDNSLQQGGGGADHVDGGTSRFDKNGVIYQAICANCKGFGPITFPTTPGVWSPNNPSDNCNLAMIKIAFNLAGVAGAVKTSINGVPRDTTGCIPLTVDFSDTIQRAQSYEWDFGDGSAQVSTTNPTISHTYNIVGTYKVMMVAIDSNTCNIRDTTYTHIIAGDNKAILDFDVIKLNPCDSFKYRFDNTSTAPPVRPFSNQSFTWDFGDNSQRIVAGTNSVFHNYTSPGTYNVQLILNDTGYCNSPDSLTVQVRVSALVVAGFDAPPTGCVPYAADFNNTSLGGQQFLWDFGDGTTSTSTNGTHLYTVAGTYTVTLVAIDSATCNIADTISHTISIADIPTANFTWAPNPPVENTPTTFTNTSSPDAIRFYWDFGDGDTLTTTSRGPVLHQYNATGIFTACLTAYNAAGCSDTTCLPVEATVVPGVDVPNAFTPSSGDVNSKIFVRGFGIAKMKFIIWNRWGQKVFETDNRNTGWDGKVNGKLQPMDVYAYTLSVEFFDGKKTTKKGDITLVR
jgi:gliding motility-associated-like protein